MNKRIKKHRAVSESLHAAGQLPFISLSAGASACNYHTHSRRQLDYFLVLQFRPRRLCEECWRGAAEEKRNNARPNLEHARIAENRILEIKEETVETQFDSSLNECSRIAPSDVGLREISLLNCRCCVKVFYTFTGVIRL
jgi:hypothetical protein